MKTVFNRFTLTAFAAAALLITGCDKDDDYEPNTPHQPSVNAKVISSSGDSAGILQKLNEFRALAGDPVNGAPGAVGGRREVNWDGVPPNFTNNNTFPFDFFGSADPLVGNGRKRGLIMTNTGTFRIDSTSYSEVDPSYAAQFKPFSKKRLFNDMGTTVTEVTFKVPGTNNNAFVKGFGVIFSDVDQDGSTIVEFFSGTKSLGSYKVKTSPQGFSFLGVTFPDEKLTSVKIRSGNGLLATGVKDISDGGSKDLVVMDDFFYDEPKQLN